MVSVHDQLEVTYDVDSDLELPPLPELAVGRGAAVPVVEGDQVRDRFVTTYFDTPDRRLARAGLTLRRRTGDNDAGWQLTIPAAAGARREIRLPPGGDREVDMVPRTLGHMVWARSRGEPLVPVARITTDRTARHLLDATGQSLVEVADDRVEAHPLPSLLPGADGAEQPPVSWREIEVELAQGSPDLLKTLDANLRGLGVTAAGRRSKLARVLDPSPSTPTLTATSMRLTGTSPAGAVVAAYLGEQVGRILSQDVLVRVDNPDSVHTMRVATRRLRSALKTFRPLFVPEERRLLRAELRWLAAELGAARDADAIRERLLGAIDAETQQLHLAAVTGSVEVRMNQAQRAAHDHLLKKLDSGRYHRLVGALATLVDAPPLTNRATRQASTALPPRVARTYRTLVELVGEAFAAPTVAGRDQLLHEARKAVKQARYAGEAASRVFGKDASTFATAMERLQEQLDEHQDSLVIRERLQELARGDSTPGAGFVYGRLHAQEEARGDRAVDRFRSAWEASAKKVWRGWPA